MTMANKNKIMVQTIIAKDANTVWDLYTNPDHIVNWNFASDEWHCPAATNDLRIGGKYLARMEAKDGSFGFDFEAVYTEIKEFEKIGYSMGKKLGEGRQASVTFNNIGDQTEVVVTFDAESQNSVDMQRDGWQAILNNFKKYAEQQ
jgi:uncharacterized protein YndB with AHSA1/START domain